MASTDRARGELFALHVIPLQVRQTRLQRASQTDAEWLRKTIEHTSRRFQIRVAARPDDLLELVGG